MSRPLLLLLGDSITEQGSDWRSDGWICLLLNRYNRAADIAQRGMGGYSTQTFMNLVFATLAHDLTTTLRPQLITLWLGANDAALVDGPSKEQHVPVPSYKAHLYFMLALFREKAPQAQVLLITPPAVDDDRRRGSDGQDRTNTATGEYARACVDVASEMGVEVLDLYSILNALPTPQWKGMLVDGLHLNKEGNHFMEQQLVDTIKTKFPDLQTQLEQPEFPFDWLATQAPSTASVWLLRDSEKSAISLSEVTTPTLTVDSYFSVLACTFVVLLGLLWNRRVRAKPSQEREAEETRLLKH